MEQINQVIKKIPKPQSAKTALEYLNKLTKLVKENDVKVRRIGTYWANQTLSGRQFGLRDTGPNREELVSMLRGIAVSASAYKEKDPWFVWTIFKNDFESRSKKWQMHIRNIYTLMRYAQMKFKDMSDKTIQAVLDKEVETNKNFKIANLSPTVKHDFDQAIAEFR